MKYQNLNREKKKDTIANNRNSFIIKILFFPFSFGKESLSRIELLNENYIQVSFYYILFALG